MHNILPLFPPSVSTIPSNGDLNPYGVVTAATVQAGALSVLDRNGVFLGTLGTVATVNGPWGMAIHDIGNGVSGQAKVFLSNVLAGLVSRIDITYSATSLSASALVLSQRLQSPSGPSRTSPRAVWSCLL